MNITFFKITAYIGLILYLYSLWLFYNSTGIGWIFSSIFFVFISIIIVLGKKFTKNILAQSGFHPILIGLLIKFSCLVYFMSIMHSVIVVLLSIPIQDNSLIIFPSIISLFIFSGTAITLAIDSEY